jgi:hypothetical protein
MRFAKAWLQPSVSVMSAIILKWWYTLRMIGQTNRIATAALEESWVQVRSKAAILSPGERAHYLRVQAASVVQRHVDKLVLEHPAIPASVANGLVVRASDRLVHRLSRRLGKPAPSAVLSVH